MGIDTRAKIIYGLPYNDLSFIDNLDDLLDEGTLDYASPYYDSYREDWIVGVKLPLVMNNRGEFLRYLRNAKSLFEKLTDGAVGKIIVSPDVT